MCNEGGHVREGRSRQLTHSALAQQVMTGLSEGDQYIC